MKNNQLIALLLLVGAIFSSCSRQEEKAAVNTGEIVQELRSVNKIEFASMSVTKTVRSERTDWYKIGKRIAVYSYDTKLSGYIDMSELMQEDVVYDPQTEVLTVMLPPVKVDVKGRDMTMRKEYENIGLLRSNLDSKERAEMKEKGNESFLREVKNNPEFRRQLTETAERKERSYFETLLAGDSIKVNVEFK